MGFKAALGALRMGRQDSRIHRYRQADFDAIPGSPWVYWMPASLRQLFQTLPNLGGIAQLVVGLRSSDNSRFVRFWWEPGLSRVARACQDRRAAKERGKKWFPYQKGGGLPLVWEPGVRRQLV